MINGWTPELKAHHIMSFASREFARVYSLHGKYILMSGLIRINTDSDFLENAKNPGTVDLKRDLPCFMFCENPPTDWRTGPRRMFVSFIGAVMEGLRPDGKDIFPSERGSIIDFLDRENNEKLFKFLQDVTLFGCRPDEYIEKANAEIPFNVDAVKKYCAGFDFPGDKKLDFNYVRYPVEFIRFTDGLSRVM